MRIMAGQRTESYLSPTINSNNTGLTGRLLLLRFGNLSLSALLRSPALAERATRNGVNPICFVSRTDPAMDSVALAPMIGGELRVSKRP